ncbi:hypothetical protein [Clostridium sp. SGI.024]|uniref:hypothetical protein n=1 Tax=Clostridium sp. SGI.024 TaxID=3420551 RepID=UPI003D01A77E
MNNKKIIATITLSTILIGGVKPLVTYAVDSNVKPAIENVTLAENKAKEDINKNDMTATYIENFKNRIGLNELIKFIQIDQNHHDFVKWIYDTPEAMKLYLTGGYASAVTQNSMASYQYRNQYNKANELKALEVWYKIWNKHEKSREGINLKIAIATSLEFASGVNTWLRGIAIDPVTRYENYASDKTQSILMDDFFKLTVQEMRNVVNAKITDEEMVWLRDYISKNKPNMINRNKITQGHTLLKYQTVNPDTKASVQGPNFYGPKPTIDKVIKYGGVCGAMSKFSSILSQSYGIPAFPVGQPGHCAYVFLDANHTYSLGYDVYGWEKSGNYYTTLPYIRLHNILSKDPSRYARYEASEDSRFKALIAKDDATKIKYLNEAIAKEPINYFAWEEKIKVVKKSSNEEELQKVINQAKEALKYHQIVRDNVTRK